MGSSGNRAAFRNQYRDQLLWVLVELRRGIVSLIDRHGRKLNYLRVSLTDRCNLRCVYCMPLEGIPLLPREDVLRIHEFERLLQLFIHSGISKIRLTGGEPLLRRKIISLVSLLSQYPSLKEIALTTNGIFLEPLVLDLKEAGLNSVNISLDSLDPHRYARLTRGGDFCKVWNALLKSMECGLKVKINVVAMSDLDFKEVCDFVELAEKYPVEVRFLEFMPLCGSASLEQEGLDFNLLKKWISKSFALESMQRKAGDVAQTYKITSGLGQIGFIDSMTDPFCGDCNRLRLSSTGQMRLCLFSQAEIDLRTPLRGGASDEDLMQLIQTGAYEKPRGHEEIRRFVIDSNLPMIRSIGG